MINNKLFYIISYFIGFITGGIYMGVIFYLGGCRI